MKALISSILTVLLATALAAPIDAQTLVKDINPSGSAGFATGNPMATVGGKVYFPAHDGVGVDLWVSDGTDAGTTKVPLPAGVSFGGALAELGGRLIFSGFTTATGTELYSSDGTAAGTFLIKDIYTGPMSSSPTAFGRVGSLLYFSARDTGPNYELYRTDGTPSGTWLVKDIHPTSGSAPHFITPVDGGPTFVFGATAGAILGGRELYVSDGTAAGTKLLVDINPGTSPSEPAWMTALGDKVYFNATDGVTGFELWETDGTVAGTKRVTDHFTGLGPRSIAASAGKVWFEAETKASPTSGNELWSYHPPSSTVALAADLGAGANGSFPNHLTPVGSRTLYFSAHGPFGVELYAHDTITDTTGLVKDIWVGSTSGNPRATTSRGRSGASEYRFATTTGGKVFFFADDATRASELHVLGHGATATVVGVGCGAAGRRPTLAATDPKVGTVMTISGTNAYTGGSAWGFVLIGFPLAKGIPFGGGCELWIDLSKPGFYAATFPVTSSSWSTPFPVPAAPALEGVSFAIQAYFGPTDAPAAYDVTNAVIATVGS